MIYGALMDSETALNVAWIGVLAGVAGGGIAGLAQYVIHRTGSRLRWRDQLRDAAAEFMTAVHAADMTAMHAGHATDEHRALMQRAQLSFNRLMLLAPQSVTDAAGSVLEGSGKALEGIMSGQDLSDEQWTARYSEEFTRNFATLCVEVRKALKSDKRRA